MLLVKDLNFFEFLNCKLDKSAIFWNCLVSGIFLNKNIRTFKTEKGKFSRLWIDRVSPEGSC